MRKVRRHLAPLLIVLALALALSGCGGRPGEDGPAAGGGQAAQATEQPAGEPTPAAIEAPAAGGESSSTPEAEATEIALEPPPAFSEEITATDPQTVALGRGHPQVIEFFAFW